MTQTTKAAALAFTCPFCSAPAGQPCRTRNSGREQDWPHSRRIALSRPIEERMPPPRRNALCCICGNRRTVSGDYYRYQDPNYDDGPLGKSQGWRSTQTLKCDECGEQTRHAVLSREDVSWRDRDEELQRCALGDDSGGWSKDSRERIRHEYREMPIPRNPNLGHRWWMTEAKAAWEDGTKRVIALCGEPVTLKREPQSSTKERTNGFLIAEQFSDIEYTDLETGLSWIDMDCVDCCRVSNNSHLAYQRSYLEQLLAWFAARPEQIEDVEVESLATVLGSLYDKARGQST